MMLNSIFIIDWTFESFQIFHMLCNLSEVVFSLNLKNWSHQSQPNVSFLVVRLIVMLIFNGKDRTSQSQQVFCMLFNALEMMLSINIVTRSFRCLQISNMFVNFFEA